MFSDKIHDESPLNWVPHLHVEEQGEKQAAGCVC